MTAPLDFTFKPFEEMTPADYEAVGLMSGLEIHQQLKTKRKLFCRCPAGRYSEHIDAEILRHMRPTLSELGEYDGTALMEFKTKKEIIYLLNNETVCTYEMDDAPPFEIDPEAVDIAIEVALLLKLNTVSELHIARKQYLDGSIPTGFQRTTILGIDGEIPYKDRKIGIIQLGLEEDSCREVSDLGHTITFRTDRLGMPLIETVTYPDMKTPQEVAEVGELLRRLVRATGKVRQGAGAARQDVNVSIKGGTRIEIKGVPSLRRIPRLIYNEAMRQHNLLKIRDELLRRGITEENLDHRSADISGIVRRTSYLPIQNAIERGLAVVAVKLKGFGGILAHPTQEHTFFGQEFSDRVKVIACMMEHPNMLHSDMMDPGISRGQWNRIRKRLQATPEDAIVCVWGSEEDVDTAVKEIVIRAQDATKGVPSETRQAFRDGTNGFERILPGADRMYPDTDEPPIAIDDRKIAMIQSALPELPWDREDRYIKQGVAENAARMLAYGELCVLFDAVQGRTGCDNKLLSYTILHVVRHFLKKGAYQGRRLEDALSELFLAIKENRVRSEAIRRILTDYATNETESMQELLERYSITGSEEEELTQWLQTAKEVQEQLWSDDKQARQRYSMGLIMHRMRGRIDPNVVQQRLETVVGADHD